MCAAVGIDAIWYPEAVHCLVMGKRELSMTEYFLSNKGDKCAAWRYASVKLAAAVGRAM